MRLSLAAGACCAAGAILIWFYSSSTDIQSEMTAPTETRSVKIATYEPTSPGGYDLPVEGNLAVRQGCLVIEASDGIIVLPVLPEGKFFFDEKGNSLTLIGVGESAVGSTVGFAGTHADSMPGLNLMGCGNVADQVFRVNYYE